jgi:hypothetical protein
MALKIFSSLYICSIVSCSIAVQSPLQTNTVQETVAKKQFNLLKELEGNWSLIGGVRLGEELDAKPEEVFATYSVNSGGHAVVEKIYVGQAKEMVTVYYLSENKLRMDHYCSLGNQPRMIATDSENANEINFQLITVDNMPDKDDLHISSHGLEFKNPNELIMYWGATKNQEDSNGSMYKLKLIP